MKRGEKVFVKYMKETPVGTLKIVSDGKSIKEISFFDADAFEDLPDRVTEEAEKQLEEYFEGNRKSFDLTLALDGTPFRLKVWNELCNIPYGMTVSYKYIAQEINCRAARPIGGANNKNPIVIVIPCHRVVGEDGSLTGYGGGLWRKEVLLELERKYKEV